MWCCKKLRKLQSHLGQEIILQLSFSQKVKAFEELDLEMLLFSIVLQDLCLLHVTVSV